MKLLDYIRGLRKGKEAHRLEKESMQDPFLADAMDGYSQVEGSHEQRIEKIRTEISAHCAKKKNTYAVTWSIAASLVIGVGIGSDFLFLKNGMEEDTFLAKETVYTEEVSQLAPKEKEKVATLPPAKTKEVSTDEVTVKRTVAQAKATPVATAPMMEETIEPTAMTDEAVEATMDKSIKGKVTDEKGEPLPGVAISYKGTTIGTVTDLNGEFSLIKKDSNDMLTAQYIGYNTVEMPVDTSRTMLFAMNADHQKLEEVVVVAYGKKEKVANARTPKPVIGMRKYRKYLKENLIHPTDKTCADVKGKVVLTFLVDANGRPYQIAVKDSLCESCDKEAIRLVREGADWTHGTQSVEITVKF